MSQPQTYHEIIKQMPVRQFKVLAKVPFGGSLEARKLGDEGIQLYWRWTHKNVTDRAPIGTYDPSAPIKKLQPSSKGYSIAAAFETAREFAKLHHENLAVGGYAGVKAKELARVAATKEKAEADRRDAENNTLKNLLVWYCRHLKKLGRLSYRDASSIFQLHIFNSWPSVAALPANQVSAEMIADMMRRLLEMGKGRTSNKLRAFVRSAYQVAKASRSKASIPAEFKAFGVTHNPAADTEPDESQNRADNNPLSAVELKQYWEIIKPLPGLMGAVLRLHLLTGAQRQEQLCRLKTVDVTDHAITLHDSKGRPGQPARAHAVPLVKVAAAAMLECQAQGAFALSTDGGKTHIAATTLSRWAVEVVGANIPDFQTKRLRSGVETLLASAKVSRDDRGRLQSHGISGVQARSYDGHDYLDEKRQALETLYRLLEASTAGNVRAFKK
ncbi:MAG: integrase [Burkholderiaceae bacterium]